LPLVTGLEINTAIFPKGQGIPSPTEVEAISYVFVQTGQCHDVPCLFKLSSNFLNV